MGFRYEIMSLIPTSISIETKALPQTFTRTLGVRLPVGRNISVDRAISMAIPQTEENEEKVQVMSMFVVVMADEEAVLMSMVFVVTTNQIGRKAFEECNTKEIGRKASG
ncbi:hypothetical protein L2E82_48225 [Cichorium intybus]|uniref:Uncharacterized protein n=1 Tax=Cichorium intybus TaxID=13427 RepID=A0ACB8YXT0_CICIN|nr:hypothetical protein L2E82_48225 [Cichorium intybus]